MKLFSKEKPLYRRACWLILDLKILGIVLPVISWWLLGAYLLEHTSWGIIASSCLGFFIGFIFTLFTLPVWFIKSDAQPSSFQRFCRNYFLKIAKGVSLLGFASRSGESVELRDIRFFQYYLSHPKTPENIRADQVDTTQFDWQNPKEWPF